MKAGIVRDEKTLKYALDKIGELRSRSMACQRKNAFDLKRYLELKNMLLISEMICRAALLRTETRGSHYRRDFPEEDNLNWLRNIIITPENGELELISVPVEMDILSLEEIE